MNYQANNFITCLGKPEVSCSVKNVSVEQTNEKKQAKRNSNFVLKRTCVINSGTDGGVCSFASDYRMRSVRRCVAFCPFCPMHCAPLRLSICMRMSLSFGFSGCVAAYKDEWWGASEVFIGRLAGLRRDIVKKIC